jgi:hypothetical protein
MEDVSREARVLQSSNGTKLSLAKLVEMRRRSRIDRARQLASNIETQAQILRSTQLYNLEAARLQLKHQLGGMGDNIPQVARAIHDERVARLHNERVAKLAEMTKQVEELQRQQSASFIDARPQPTRKPRHLPGVRVAAGQTTLG